MTKSLKWQVDNNWLPFTNYGFDHILQHGKVTRIDFAVDVASELVDELYFYYPKMQRVEIVRTFRGETEYIQSQTDYIGGKYKAKKRVVVYDRIPAIKSHNYKKFYKNKQIPIPDNDIMRVEIRLFPQCLMKDILTLDNPFTPLLISSPQFEKYDDNLWKLFIPLARFEGAQATLARLPKKDKSILVDRLRTGKVPWWQPQKIWDQLPLLMKTIIDS